MHFLLLFHELRLIIANLEFYMQILRQEMYKFANCIKSNKNDLPIVIVVPVTKKKIFSI